MNDGIDAIDGRMQRSIVRKVAGDVLDGRVRLRGCAAVKNAN
jgi:hypothetical protein